jgi:CTP synthase (UTP-ammonia lyase)
MDNLIRVGIIGDFEKERPSHKATNEALIHCGKHLGLHLEIKWIPTLLLEQEGSSKLNQFDGLWCAPGSPYKSMIGAMNGIQFAREKDYPFIGTCGGFQHTVLEYATNMLGFEEIKTLNNPEETNVFITALSCSLVGETRKILISKYSNVYSYYQKEEVIERYNCNFGMNPEYQKLLDEKGLKVAGTDEKGEARIVELPDKRFFMATLFQPQLSSTPENPHELILAYLGKVKEFYNSVSV